MRVLSRLFRRLFLEGLAKPNKAGWLKFFNSLDGLADAAAFDDFLKPCRKVEWVVYAKEPFAGPKAVQAYLSRYTHRFAISNSRLIRADAKSVTFRVKDYRVDGSGRHKTMTLATDEFIRRFMIHVPPKGQHRIRHYGFFSNGNRAEKISHIRSLLAVAPPPQSGEETTEIDDDQPRILELPCPACPACTGCIIIIESFPPQHQPGAPYQKAAT